MKVNVNYDEIDNLKSYIDKETDKIESIYNDIKKELTDLESCWKGKDSKNFNSISEEYINDSIKSLSSLKEFSNNLVEIMKLYKDCEASFNNKIREN